MLGVVAFFVVARYRLPVVPVLIVFAAWTAVERGRARRTPAESACARTRRSSLALFAVVNASYPAFLASVRRTSRCRITRWRGRTPSASTTTPRSSSCPERSRPSSEHLRRSTPASPKTSPSNWERFFTSAGRCAEAIQVLGQIQPNDPRADQARLLFAECCEKTGRFSEAGKAYELTLKVDPNNLEALEGYIRCLEATGRWDAAAQARNGCPPRARPVSRARGRLTVPRSGLLVSDSSTRLRERTRYGGGPLGSRIATIALAVAVALAGWFIGNGFVRGRTADRYVSVKGVAERDVTANMALWPLRFVSTDDALARAQKKFDESKQAVVAFLATRSTPPTWNCRASR